MKKPRYSKIIVGFSIGFIVVYTVAVMANFYIHGIEPHTLTPYVYGFFGGEMLVMGGIKTAETLKGKGEDHED